MTNWLNLKLFHLRNGSLALDSDTDSFKKIDSFERTNDCMNKMKRLWARLHFITYIFGNERWTDFPFKMALSMNLNHVEWQLLPDDRLLFNKRLFMCPKLQSPSLLILFWFYETHIESQMRRHVPNKNSFVLLLVLRESNRLKWPLAKTMYQRRKKKLDKENPVLE